MSISSFKLLVNFGRHFSIHITKRRNFLSLSFFQTYKPYFVNNDSMEHNWHETNDLKIININIQECYDMEHYKLEGP